MNKKVRSFCLLILILTAYSKIYSQAIVVAGFISNGPNQILQISLSDSTSGVSWNQSISTDLQGNFYTSLPYNFWSIESNPLITV
jgi:hypothetical protein